MTLTYFLRGVVSVVRAAIQHLANQTRMTWAESRAEVGDALHFLLGHRDPPTRRSTSSLKALV
jgi:hypothetical protein